MPSRPDLAQLGPLDQTDAPGPGRDQHLPEPLPADPLPLFVSWFDEAAARRVQPNPNAFTLATVDADGTPSARVVLAKSIDPHAGFLIFYTNYNGRKGRALAANPRAAACFHWDLLDRQVRIEGPVTRSPASESDAYFASRPWLSRVGAWTSDQSEPIGSRDALAAKLEATMRRFGIDPNAPPAKDDPGVTVPRPPHWGGFRLWVRSIELWVGSTGRLHDRAVWRRDLRPAGEGYEAARPWVATRLQP